jgi:leucyl-tRNA synthetase
MDKNMSFDASNSASLVILMDEILTKYVANTVRTYLRNKNLPEDFEHWSKADLDSRLRCFYAEVRSASGELHKRDKNVNITRTILCLANQLVYAH